MKNSYFSYICKQYTHRLAHPIVLLVSYIVSKDGFCNFFSIFDMTKSFTCPKNTFYTSERTLSDTGAKN